MRVLDRQRAEAEGSSFPARTEFPLTELASWRAQDVAARGDVLDILREQADRYAEKAEAHRKAAAGSIFTAARTKVEHQWLADRCVLIQRALMVAVGLLSEATYRGG